MKKKVFALLMAVIMCFTACGKEEHKIEVIKNENSIKPVQLDVPRELEGHDSITLLSFDGVNGIFTVNRDIVSVNTGIAEETAEIVVYNVDKQQVIQYLNTDLTKGVVTDAVKVGENLYYTAKFPWEEKHLLYMNDGLETVEIALYEGSYEQILNCESAFTVDGENLLMSIRAENTEEEGYIYEIYSIEGENVKKLYNMSFGYPANLQNLKLNNETEPFTVDYREISRFDGEINVFEFENMESRILKTIPEVNYIYGGKVGDMLFHYNGEAENNKLAVTNLEYGVTEEIDVLKVGRFCTDEENTALYTYGPTVSDMTAVKTEGLTVTLTPVDTSAFAESTKYIEMCEDSALIMLQGYEDNSIKLYQIEI